MVWKVVVEKHGDGFIAYPVGVRGACIGQGDTLEGALEDVASAIRMHLEVFGPDAFDEGQPLDVFIAEARLSA
jgi:predicted RNase H-like HicB family nuclease